MFFSIITAIVRKQFKDIFKNKAVIIQFSLFPILCIVMSLIVNTELFSARFFATLFSTMFIGMIPLNCMVSIVSEEKEKGTLAFLKFFKISFFEYFCGISICILSMCLVSSLIFGIVSGYKGLEYLLFVLINFSGIIISMIVGSTIGLFTDNQNAAVSIATPLRMILSFLPMIAMLNPKLKTIFGFMYTQQINDLLYDLSNAENILFKLFVIFLNCVLSLFVFSILYKKS